MTTTTTITTTTSLMKDVQTIERACKADSKAFFVRYYCCDGASHAERIWEIVGKEVKLLEFDRKETLCCVGVFKNEESAKESVAKVNKKMSGMVSVTLCF